MASFSINSNYGDNADLKNGVYIGTLDDNTYPNGTFTFTNFGTDSQQKAYWKHNSNNDEWFGIYLTNADHTIWSNRLFELHFTGNSSAVTPASASVLFSNVNIVGQALYLIAYRWNSTSNSYDDLNYGSNVMIIRNYSPITIDTTEWATGCTQAGVTIARSGNGQLTVSWSGAQAGAHNTISGYRVAVSTTTPTSYTTVGASVSSYTFTVNNNTSYYGYVQTLGSDGYNSAWSASTALAAIYYSTPSVSIERNGENKLKVDWDSTVTSNGSISGYTVFLATSSGGSAVSGFSATTNASTKTYTFTTNNATVYYAGVYARGTYNSSTGWSPGLGAATKCGTPTVTASVSGTTVTITWTAAANGNNNTVQKYDLIRNTSKSTSGATTLSQSATSGTTNSPGTGTFYYGVRAKGSAGSNFYGAWSWSGAATVAGKPSVTAGNPINKSDMDALKTYLGRGTTVTVGNEITRAIAITYRPGVAITAGTTLINATWFNA